MRIRTAPNIPVIGSKYKNKYLGTIGDFGTYSFHESKNLHCGTGGALIINNEKYLKKSKLIWNRGTNREDFEKKKVNKKIISNGNINSAKDKPSQVVLNAFPLLFSKNLAIVVVAV